MMATIDELRQEPHWSYSALNTYLNICQAQYFYRYVEQAEVERIPQHLSGAILLPLCGTG